jgi:hypothetical protein
MVLLGYLLLAAIVAVVLFYLVIALLPDGGSLTPLADQRPFALPEDRRMDRSDLAAVRIPIALRGYRFAETDDLIDRLATEIAVRDDELARLRQSQQDQDARSGLGGERREQPAQERAEDAPGSAAELQDVPHHDV